MTSMELKAELDRLLEESTEFIDQIIEYIVDDHDATNE